MTYAVFSDLHANEEAFRRALADARACGAERFVCLGDIVGYGPLPAETLRLVRETCSIVLAGNHDDAVSGRGSADDFIDLAGDAVARHREALAKPDVDWLRTLPYTAEIEGARLAHGDFTDPKKFHYINDADDASANFGATDDQLLFVGHTHVPALALTGASGRVYMLGPEDFVLEDGKRYIVNPGSVGYPRETNGSCRSTYVLYDSTARSVVFRSLPFAVSSVLQRGRGKKLRKGLFAAVALATAALAALAVFFAKPTEEVVQKVEVMETRVAEDPLFVLETRHLTIPPGARKVKANITVIRGPILLTISFLDSNGCELRLAKQTVVHVWHKPFAVPDGAVTCVFTVLKTRAEDQPRITELNPAAEF